MSSNNTVTIPINCKSESHDLNSIQDVKKFKVRVRMEMLQNLINFPLGFALSFL